MHYIAMCYRTKTCNNLYLINVGRNKKDILDALKKNTSQTAMRYCWKIAENISEKILEALAMHRHSTRNYNIFAVCSKLTTPLLLVIFMPSSV
jgi:hypothetical protein